MNLYKALRQLPGVAGILIVLFSFAGFSIPDLTPSLGPSKSDPGKWFREEMQVTTIDEDIMLVHLHDSVFMHVTWHEDKDYGRFSSNGLVIVRKGRVLFVDTPMDNDKTERLVTWLKDSLSATVTMVIAGHFHDDCLGGLAYLQSTGARSIANVRTVEKCRELQLPVPEESFSEMLVFDFHGEEIECRFFGPGHTFDNITVWLPSQRILFGGCLVKSMHSTNLGNLSDAIVEDWDKTIKRIIDSYNTIEVVVPGHGDSGGTELLEHTIRLVNDFKNR
jgi:metallo-beta-lactamase class B